jgi:subtilisin family serine protease
MGMVQGQLQQAIDNNKEEIPGDLVTSLIGVYYTLNYYLPYKDAFYQAAVNSLEKYGKDVEKVDIWKKRNVSLEGKEGLARVVVGIWDTGVDMEILPEENRWTNKNEKFDGTDTDRNGFVDDVYGIAYTLEGLKDPHYLFPEAHDLSNINDYQKYLKGLTDLMANINSGDASEIRQYISGLRPDEVDPFLEKLSMYSLYSHGTHVAGIAIEGNPYAAVLVARLTGDYRSIPAPYTDRIVEQLARSQKEIIKYFKDNGVRVVNMSWSESYESIVSILEMNGVGENDEERKELGKKYFNTLLQSFTEAVRSAPEILFITSSGNSNDDVDFTGSYPNTVDVPNLITVGAVDIEGKKTNFTTEGESVDVYANGYEVESYVPGGNRIPLSGTSMSTPQVVNLAAKMLAVNPGLTPLEVKEIIVKTSTRSDEDENVLLIQPIEAVKLARK